MFCVFGVSMQIDGFKPSGDKIGGPVVNGHEAVKDAVLPFKLEHNACGDP